MDLLSPLGWCFGPFPLVWFLLVVLLDRLLGDPQVAWHPVRILGWWLGRTQSWLFALGWQGLGASALHFGLVAGAAWAVGQGLVLGLGWLSPWVGWGAAMLLASQLVAGRDLEHHCQRVEQASDLAQIRQAAAMLVGRNLEQADAPACRRAALESLAENFVDGVISPLCFLLFLGLPGLLVFKAISTLDSMTGYKKPPYLLFGRVGARLDDLCNWLPARLTWLLFSLAALLLPGFSAKEAWLWGWRQRGALPSPNSAWAEASLAGALGVRLVGPLVKEGQTQHLPWLGHPEAEAGGQAGQIQRALLLTRTALALFLLAVLPLGWGWAWV